MSATTSPTPSVSGTAPEARRGILGFFAKFAVLKNAQRELWLTFAIKFICVAAYSLSTKTFVLWLSSDLGFNDQKAGAIVSWGWAPAMTVFTDRKSTRLNSSH